MSAQQKSSLNKIGVIAGGGSLPARLLHACDKSDIEVFVVGFEGQTEPDIFEGRRHMFTRLGAAGQIINTLKSHNIKDLVFIGSIRRPTVGELRPDLRTAQFFAKIAMRALGDNGLFGALRMELQNDGFIIHGIQEFANDLLAVKGPVGRYKPKKTDWVDISRGLDIAKGLGVYDVGQAVIVQEGIVLGVEAIEGTDELIKRCRKYKRKGRGGVLIKTSKPGQDQQFDLPTVGPDTVRNCIDSGLNGLVIEAGKTLVIDPQLMAEMADKHKFFIMGVDPETYKNDI